jgi:hypothetical protein
MLNGSASGAVSRKANGNKFAFEAGAAYGRSSVLVARDLDGDKAISGPDELTREDSTSTNNWATRARYDRFITTNNAAYLLGQVGADRIAGKKLVGGGQVGYSRQLYASVRQTAVAELGYDLSFESYVSGADGVTVHSARMFAGELFKLTEATGLYANAEVLLNLNHENALVATDTTGQSKGVDAFKDTRMIGKAGLTTTLWKNLGFGFGVTVKYDQNPAPRPTIKGFAYGSSAMPYQPFADKLDVITEASLILTLL